MRKIKFSKSFNLERTFYPSFNLALYEKIDKNKYVKLVGLDEGKLIEVRDNGVIYTSLSYELLKYTIGLWFNPLAYISQVKGESLWVAKAFTKYYADVGLSVNPLDKEYIFIAIFLSRRTDYHKNVVNWCKKLWLMSKGDLGKIVRGNLKLIGTSFQLRQLPLALKDYIDLNISRKSADLWEIRRNILKCRWCGPKIADAYLLFAEACTEAVPCDKHLISMVKKLNLIRFSKLPVKRYCLKYTCEECPLTGDCLRSLFSQTFGKLSGWLQTLFYIHDKIYCRSELCKICFLKNRCLEAKVCFPQ
ncbi:MAG: hypothetical protein DRJ52_00140 [Thermoprotei archaeon]|nr:MAG: hypothetical protein DRJ52_00140 [Thermoprotei archaeon]RLF00978.1 MAG: hypothetical protein DRJ63_01050 [Thermoprotei archaeon]